MRWLKPRLTAKSSVSRRNIADTPASNQRPVIESKVNDPAVMNWRTECMTSRSPHVFGGTDRTDSKSALDSNSISPVHAVFVAGRAGLSMTLTTRPSSTPTVLK